MPRPRKITNLSLVKDLIQTLTKNERTELAHSLVRETLVFTNDGANKLVKMTKRAYKKRAPKAVVSAEPQVLTAANPTPVAAAPVKRKPGRPRKNPVQAVAAAPAKKTRKLKAQAAGQGAVSYTAPVDD